MLLAVTGLCGPVIISEVMFNPEGTDSPNEFVELTNLGLTSVDLSGWGLSDLHSTDAIIGSQPIWPFGSRPILGPGERAVIFEADYDTTLGRYRDLIPGTTLILFVDDNAIGNGLSNDGDELFLINDLGATVDSVSWGPGFPAGHSLEKVILDDCQSPTNWQPSLALDGTPGGTNSVMGREIDLALDSLGVQSATPPRGFTLTAYLTNSGVLPTGGQLIIDGVVVAIIPVLAAGTTGTVVLGWEAPPDVLGIHTFTAALAIPSDYDDSNDSLVVGVYIPAPPLSLIINEVLYRPAGGEPEWVELVNTTASTVNLQDWVIRDPVRAGVLPAGVLSAGAYAVITGDSASIASWPQPVTVLWVPGFPALNDGGDQVSLLSPDGVLIDAVDYSTLPLTPAGRSLEKLDPALPAQAASSWAVSPAALGHTGGQANAAFAPGDPAGLTLSPNPLEINRAASILTLQYATPFPAINLHVAIYDLAGRRVGTIFNEGPVPGSAAITWDARSLDLVQFKTGQYVLVFQARDTGSNDRWETMERLILVH